MAERPDLERALSEASGVRFLCSGNVVRSAFAELYARHLGLPLPVDSAATHFENERLFGPTRAALAARGVSEEILAAFRPRPIWRLEATPEPRLVVLAMAPMNLEAWRRLHPDHDRSYLLREVEGKPEAIADPVLDGADFDQVFEAVARCVERLERCLEECASRDRLGHPPTGS
jgi:protein-tyrosine-phosphatase